MCRAASPSRRPHPPPVTQSGTFSGLGGSCLITGTADLEVGLDKKLPILINGVQTALLNCTTGESGLYSGLLEESHRCVGRILTRHPCLSGVLECGTLRCRYPASGAQTHGRPGR